MPSPSPRADRFTYIGYEIEPATGDVRCTYATGGHTFTERFSFGPAGHWDSPAVEAAVRILFLLAGISYYKTTAAHTVDLGSTPTSADERSFLGRYYVHGLGEFAYRNGIDLSRIDFVGPDASPSPVPYAATAQRPLIPFGGGIDSIVTVDALRAGRDGAALCIVHPPGDRFAAIEGAAGVTGLPALHIERELSPLVRRSGELGFLNGHVPVTAVISAAALVAAVLSGRDAVVLSNEHSASVPTLVVDGVPINHQWSKGIEFERLFHDLVASSLGDGIAVFSYLRCRSELWVAREFSRLKEFHGVFRSCNRAFLQDPRQRLDHWCGECDKCCFIDLILAPFMGAGDLGEIFGRHEPLADAALEERFRALLGCSPEAKPFECVGDVDECRTAVLLAAGRSDRATTTLLQSLRAEVAQGPGSGRHEMAGLLDPQGPHYIPDGYAPADLLVRAH